MLKSDEFGKKSDFNIYQKNTSNRTEFLWKNNNQKDQRISQTERSNRIFVE